LGGPGGGNKLSGETEVYDLARTGNHRIGTVGRSIASKEADVACKKPTTEHEKKRCPFPWCLTAWQSTDLKKENRRRQKVLYIPQRASGV